MRAKTKIKLKKKKIIKGKVYMVGRKKKKVNLFIKDLLQNAQLYHQCAENTISLKECEKTCKDEIAGNWKHKTYL